MFYTNFCSRNTIIAFKIMVLRNIIVRRNDIWIHSAECITHSALAAAVRKTVTFGLPSEY